MENKLVKCVNLNISNKSPFTLIAGPCQLENEKHALEVREALGGIKGPLMKVAQVSATIPDLLPDDVLDPLGSKMFENYTDYKSSRKDWERTYTQGLELLGFNYDDRTEPFKGASGATHPVLAEAVSKYSY